MMVARIIDHPSSTGVIPTPYNPDPALLAIVEIIRDGLIRDQHVRLHNFGTFRLRWSKQRQIRHPQTGAVMTVGPMPRITFTPAKHLRDFIDPDRKTPVPLNETNQSNLRESVQDIIDENYTTPEIVFTDSHEKIQSKTANDQRPNKRWALGLLAAIPLILMLLQSDFTNESTSKDKTESTKTSIKAIPSTAPEITKVPTLQKSINNIPSNTLEARNLPDNDANRENSTITATVDHPETSPKSHFMKPQVHTIQPGENLWKLAEHFYGNALLWPHIYRANMRTLSDPDKIFIGRQLVIPGLQRAPERLSPGDKALIAEGYYEVYQLNRMNHSTQAIYFLIGAIQYSKEWLINKRSAIPRKDWKTLEKISR